jgi:hypothetical protein
MQHFALLYDFVSSIRHGSYCGINVVLQRVAVLRSTLPHDHNHRSVITTTHFSLLSLPHDSVQVTKYRMIIVPDIVQVPVSFKIFILFPPCPPRSALCLVMQQPDVRMTFLHAVSAVLLWRVDFFFAFYNYNTYGERDIRVTSVI